MAIIRENSEADAEVEVATAAGHAGADIDRPGHKAFTFFAAESSVDAQSTPRQPINSGQHISVNAKNAAMQAFAQLPPLSPVASVSYKSNGRLLVIADEARQVAQAIEGLDVQLTIAVLWTGAAAPPIINETEIVSGTLMSLRGYLGAFELVFAPLSEALGTASPAQTAPFDLVLDLRSVPMFAMHQPPQGYFHAVDQVSLAKARAELPEMVGEFEKPKFFAYKESICAHSRSKKTGCNKCIDICSAEAISSFGDIVKIDPHLCMGCGACATVCPSGAMSYQYPLVADRGSQLKTMLNAYRVAAKGQGAAPVVLFHNATDGREAIAALARSGDADGLPANFLPLETWHIASAGLDVLLGAIAYGAGHVAILATGSEAPQYLAALKTEMALGETILHALGFSGAHFSLLALNDGVISADDLQNIASGETVPVPAGFNLSNDKRGTLEFVIEHFMRHANVRPAEIALPAGSLYGALNIDKQKCTMCMACVGACPESALMDGGEIPQLRFLERNCVQCGLCENTCPESAIALFPRLLLGEARKTEVVLNEAEPFDCISCGKPLGTKQMIDNMLGKLAGHSMFQGEGKLKRLQMCADCRVVDMMSNKQEYSILTGKSMGQQS